MEYRRIGSSGLRVGRLSLGSWMTFGEMVDAKQATKTLAEAHALGINHIDTAEAYAMGEAEKALAVGLHEIGWDREALVLSSKLYWGLRDEVNWSCTLNRKYLMRSIDGCLSRLNTDYLDILYCHRPDPNTPISEVVWAMSDLVASGKVLYWGTSEWSPGSIKDAFTFAERYHLRAPIVEQPELNLTWKQPFRQRLAPLREELGLGLITWSPLASGMLSGKYLGQVPDDSRAAHPAMDWLRPRLIDDRAAHPIRQLIEVARELDTTPAALSIAWCLRQLGVDSVILGARSPRQLRENVSALELADALDADVIVQLDELFPDDLERLE